MHEPLVDPLGEDLEIESILDLDPQPRLAPRTDLWRTLRPGDRVRLEEVPPEFLQAPESAQGEPSCGTVGTSQQNGLLAIYEHLVSTGAVLTVQRVDSPHALPWAEFHWRKEGGRAEHHLLALNHSGLRLVEGA